MCQTHCDNLSIDENISLPRLRELATAAGKSFGGNLKLTTVLLLGNEDDARRDALRCLAEGGEKGFILAPGCDLPFAVPPANLEAVADMVFDDFKREIASHQSAATTTDSFEDIPIPDYGSEDDVIIDVVTLDSGTCPPCQYMVTAAQKAAAKSHDVRVVEHKITNRDGLGYMTRLGVAAIPTICIDGKPTFASIIPTLPDLVAAVEKRRAEKTPDRYGLEISDFKSPQRRSSGLRVLQLSNLRSQISNRTKRDHQVSGFSNSQISNLRSQISNPVRNPIVGS